MNLARQLQHQIADRYQIRGVLGQGAMGEVFLAFDQKLEREVAIKVIGADFARHPRARERFSREARAIAQLRHPNIVEVFDYSGADSTQLFIVMEKLEGPNLYSLLHKVGKLPEAIAAAILHELCLALEHAHQKGVIHRDLKPENVIVEWTGRVVLTDFGLVKAFVEDNLLNTRSTSHTEVLGTPGFMPPEQLRGEALGPHSDVFALGAVFFNLLTKRLPFESNNFLESRKLIERGTYHDPRSFRREISHAALELIDQCIQAQPKHRLASVQAVREKLTSILRANQVVDPRAELIAFLRAPESHAAALLQREQAYLRERIKLHTLDRDTAAAERARRRLKVLADLASAAEPRRPSRVHRPGRAMPAVALAIALGLVAGVGSGLVFGTPELGQKLEALFARLGSP